MKSAVHVPRKIAILTGLVGPGDDRMKEEEGLILSSDAKQGLE